MYVHVRFSPLSGLRPHPCAPPRPRTALVTSGKRAGVHEEPGRGLAFIVVLHCSSSQVFNVSWLLQWCAAVWLNDCTCACACGIPDRAGYDGYTRSRPRGCATALGNVISSGDETRGQRSRFWICDRVDCRFLWPINSHYTPIPRRSIACSHTDTNVCRCLWVKLSPAIA